ncbi:MAG: PAS domain-containing protein [Spirochaetota bacterium]
MRFSYTAFMRVYTFFSILFFILGVLAVVVGGQALIAEEAWSDPSIRSAVTVFRLVVVFLFGAGFVISGMILMITQRRGFTAYKRIIDRLSTARSTQFNLNISFPEQDELGDLGRYLNRFVRELREFDRIKVERLRAYQQQVSYLAEAAGKGIVVVNRENRITFANSSFRQSFNLGEKTVVGLPVGTVLQNERVLQALEQIGEKPRDTVLDDLKIKSGEVLYKTKVTLVPIITSEVRLIETMLVFEYIQKKMLQL